MLIAIFAFFGMAISYVVRMYFIHGKEHDNRDFFDAMMDWLITCITIIVVAVPEGLPL